MWVVRPEDRSDMRVPDRRFGCAFRRQDRGYCVFVDVEWIGREGGTRSSAHHPLEGGVFRFLN